MTRARHRRAQGRRLPERRLSFAALAPTRPLVVPKVTPVLAAMRLPGISIDLDIPACPEGQR